MDEVFLLGLPSDPVEAFSLYEKKAREDNTDFNGYFDRVTYMCDMIGFIQAHDIDIGVNQQIPYDDHEFDMFFSQAQQKIRIYAARMSVHTAHQKKAAVSPVYIMTPSIRKEIHHYISLIRETLDGLNSLPVQKKEILMKRLDAFAAEVNKDRTRLEGLGSSFVYAMKKVGEGTKELEPVVGYIERIFKAVGKSEEEKLNLPAPEEKS
jgi:hypothetical protein